MTPHCHDPVPDHAEIIEDEYTLLDRLLPLAGKRILDLGCGKAEMSRRIAAEAAPAEVLALETDAVQLEANLASEAAPRLRFGHGVAEALPLEEGSVDVAMMLKSLHHVPEAHLDDALRELHRVLVPGGWLYLSEPVYAGPLNEAMRLFHDEGRVRQLALEAVHRAVAAGLFVEEREVFFQVPVFYRDFDEFDRRMMQVTHTALNVSEAVKQQVRAALAPMQGADGIHTTRPMRVNLLRRP